MTINGAAAKRMMDSIETQNTSTNIPKLEAQLANLVETDGKINQFLIEVVSEKITERDIENERKKHAFRDKSNYASS
jgi:hypothetical protein